MTAGPPPPCPDPGCDTDDCHDGHCCTALGCTCTQTTCHTQPADYTEHGLPVMYCRDHAKEYSQ